MDKHEPGFFRGKNSRYPTFCAIGMVADILVFLLTKKLSGNFWLSVLLAALACCGVLLVALLNERPRVEGLRWWGRAAIAFACIIGIDFSFMWFLSIVFLLPETISKIIASVFAYIYLLLSFFHLSKRQEEKKAGFIESSLYFLSAGLVSGIRVFYYYSRNPSFYSLGHCVLLAMFLFFISTLIYLFFSIWIKRGGAVINACLIWAVFWNGSSVITWYPLGIFVALLLVFLCCITYLLHHHPVNRWIALSLCGVVGILFLFNMTMAVLPNAHMWIHRNDHRESKSVFNIDEGKEHPNIYWLHMDGMIGFDQVELLLGDDQRDFKKDLADRGFLINPNATLDVGWTAFSIPSLTSPTVYDSYIQPLLEPLHNMTSKERHIEIGLREYNREVFNELELFSAFDAIGYDDYFVLFDIGNGLERIPADYRYGHLDGYGSSSNLIALLSDLTVLHAYSEPMTDLIIKQIALSDLEDEVINNPTYDYVYEGSWVQYSTIRHYDRCLAAIFEKLLTKDSPKCIYIQDLITHYPYIYDENGVYQFISELHLMDQYLPQQKYAIKVMLGMVDRIIENDPEAVIILQADHGVDEFNRSELAEQGFSDEQMLALSYSTFSAIRLPEKYGTLNEPLDPLDITRYLVNHFVGEGNYDYVYYHEED